MNLKQHILGLILMTRNALETTHIINSNEHRFWDQLHTTKLKRLLNQYFDEKEEDDG